MEYLKIWCSFSEIIEPLNDSERGRLFTAMLEYAESGVLPDFKGNERYVWPAAKQNIDRARCENDRQKANGSKGGRPRKETQENQVKPTETQENQVKPTETLKDNNKENITPKKEENVNARAVAEMPFDLTESDIHSSMLQDRQIEEAAKSIGLQTTEAGMIRGRELCRKYGLDKVLDAISKSVDVPKWAYVEGVLKGKGKQNDNRGNNSSVQGSSGEKPSKYAFLFDDAV